MGQARIYYLARQNNCQVKEDILSEHNLYIHIEEDDSQSGFYAVRRGLGKEEALRLASFLNSLDEEIVAMAEGRPLDSFLPGLKKEKGCSAGP